MRLEQSIWQSLGEAGTLLVGGGEGGLLPIWLRHAWVLVLVRVRLWFAGLRRKAARRPTRSDEHLYVLPMVVFRWQDVARCRDGGECDGGGQNE